MADWTQIPDATFDTDRPILGSTHLAIVRNFEAVTEGADNAPRVRGSAVRHNLLAEFDTGPISTESPIEFVNLEPSMGLVIEIANARGGTIDSEGNPVPRGVVCAVSNNNGSSYTTFHTTALVPFGESKLFMLMFGPPSSFTLSDSISEFEFNGPANAVRFSTQNPLNNPNTVTGSFRIFSLVRERE